MQSLIKLFYTDTIAIFILTSTCYLLCIFKIPIGRQLNTYYCARVRLNGLLCVVCVCVHGSGGSCATMCVVSRHAPSAFASVTGDLNAIRRFSNACPICRFIPGPAGNVRITTAWGPDETDLGVNELLADRQRSSMHLIDMAPLLAFYHLPVSISTRLLRPYLS